MAIMKIDASPPRLSHLYAIDISPEESALYLRNIKVNRIYADGIRVHTRSPRPPRSIYD